MDDKNFDDLLKGKLNDYEYPDVTSEALESFHGRAASFQSVPWYAKSRVGIYGTASFILLTLLNGMIVWYGINSNENSLAKIREGASPRIVDSLMLVIDRLKSTQQEPAVFIINSPDKQTGKLENDHHGQERIGTTSNLSHSTNDRLYLGAVTSLPLDIFERLSEEGVLETKDGEAYLLITDRISKVRHSSYASGHPLKLVAIEQAVGIDSNIHEVESRIPVTREVDRMSVKMLNRMVDHRYSSGIGINLAPHLDLVKGVYSQGTGSIAPRIGLTAEWVVSPHWSIETSIDYLTTKFTINKNLESFNLPNLSTEFGRPESAQISNGTLSSPVNMKYRFWVSQKHQVFIKAGFTPYFYLRSQYIYRYAYPNRPPDSDLSVSTVEQRDQTGYYGRTFNMAVGIGRLVKKKKQFEMAIFYENSMGKVSKENIGMQLFGIRAGYSIGVK